MQLSHRLNMLTVSSTFLALVMYGAPTLYGQTTERWTQWRGPSRDGQVAGSAWPDRLTDENLKQRWRVELGPSYSGPVVAEGRVFVTETDNEKFEVVRALDQRTGAEISDAALGRCNEGPLFRQVQRQLDSVDARL